MEIRPETPHDVEEICHITTAAFAMIEHSNHTEAAIIDALRSAGDLTISLVAVIGREVIGHIAFSPIQINGTDCNWFGLGPVSVRPDHQNQGIGHALIQNGLRRLNEIGANGCVVLGAPAYYKRFGFQNDPNLVLEAVPTKYFMRLSIAGFLPEGKVTYRPGFKAR